MVDAVRCWEVIGLPKCILGRLEKTLENFLAKPPDFSQCLANSRKKTLVKSLLKIDEIRKKLYQGEKVC